MLWIRGKVRYSGGLDVPGGRQVLECEDLLGLHPKAATSLRADLFTLTCMMDKFETRDLVLQQLEQTFTTSPPPQPSL